MSKGNSRLLSVSRGPRRDMSSNGSLSSSEAASKNRRTKATNRIGGVGRATIVVRTKGTARTKTRDGAGNGLIAQGICQLTVGPGPFIEGTGPVLLQAQ